MLGELPGLLVHAGPMVIFALTLTAAFGLPAPATMTLLLAGGLTAFGQLDLVAVIGAGWAGTVLGDHLARGAAARLSRLAVADRFEARMRRADAVIARWGIAGVFASRFVFPTVMTPAVNYACGLTRYPLRRFTPAVMAGEAVYVGGYAMLGRTFNTQIRQVESAATSASLLVLALVAGVVCAVILVRNLRRQD